MNTQTLTDLIAEGKKEFFVKEYQAKATDEETLGVIVAHYFKWDSRIITCFLEALEDANFHTLREQIEDLVKKEGL